MPSNGDINPGVSVRMGPVEEEMDVDEPHSGAHTNGKRKARASVSNGKSYKEASASEEEDDVPLVGHPARFCPFTQALADRLPEQAAQDIEA